MKQAQPFINRRKGKDRRFDEDPCSTMPLDLYHRKRRKNVERRAQRTLAEDYYAYTNAIAGQDKQQHS